MRLLQRCLLLLLLLSSFARADDALPVPTLDTPVTDDTGVLGYSEQHALNQKIERFNRKTGDQLAVLVVRTTHPEDVFSYANRIASAWHLGHEGQDNGVLLVVATDDHADNIQVGYGLEGVLTDSRCKDILQDTMAPYFRQGNYYGGINAGVDAIMQAAGGLHFAGHTINGGLPAFVIGFAGGLLVALIVAWLFGRPVGGVIGGLTAGMLAVALGAPALYAAVLGFVLALLIWVRITAPTQPYYNSPYRAYNRGYQDGYSDGFNNNNSSSSSSSSDSGYSGDGGNFGGGGASGNW